MPDKNAELSYVSPNWNNPDWWNDFYGNKLEPWERKSYSERDASHLLEITRRFGFEPPLKILDAGAGISYLADLATYLGHQVV